MGLVKIREHEYIEEELLERFAIGVYPAMLKFYQSEEGQRAYRDMIRTGAAKASVRAVFTGVPEFPWFAENGVEYDPETVIQREIFLDGKNVCRVNGSLVTVSILHKLGVQLINIHGQHDSATLFDEENHLQILDDFSGNEALRSAYQEKYQKVVSLRREIQRLNMDEGEKLRRMENLRFQIDEITRADLKVGEDEALEERRKILQNGEKLSDGMNAAVACLYGGDDSDGAASLLADAEREIARLSRYTDAYNGILPSVDTKDPHYQEERRLFYVAITRAKNNLFIFDVKSKHSPFVEEIFNIKN